MRSRLQLSRSFLDRRLVQHSVEYSPLSQRTMLLHDSSFHSSNRTINNISGRTVTVAFSPLFHSTLTLWISVLGVCFNLICTVKIGSILYQCRQQKQNKHQRPPVAKHVLSHNRYRYLLILTSNDFLLCLSAVISCLDEKYFFQAFLARHDLCAAHVLVWKFTLHFLPLLIVFMLCRYHFILYREFQVKYSHSSTLSQLLCSDLSILIPFVLALAWSVDGLWLWGVANMKDFVAPSPIDETKHSNLTMGLAHLNQSLAKSKESNEEGLYLPAQKTICYLQTNHNFQFTVRLVHLIQADFLLLFSLHLIGKNVAKLFSHQRLGFSPLGLLLELALHVRLCCCFMVKKVSSTFAHERQLCIYILYIFISLTLTSLPFYCCRTIEIVFDTQLSSFTNEFLNSRTFAQLLLFGASLKPILSLILFSPSSMLFRVKFSSNGHVEEDSGVLSSSSQHSRAISQSQQTKTTASMHQRQSMQVRFTFHPKFHSHLRTQSQPILSSGSARQDSISTSTHFDGQLGFKHFVVANDPNESPKIVFV